MAAKKATKKAAPVPSTGARLKKWLADPALRSKLPTSVLTPAQRAARATNSSTKTAAALANPALRAKLPDSALTPALLAKRKLNQRLNAPIVPGSSETNRDLAHETDAAVAEKYGPEEAQLKTALGHAQQYQTNVGSWYDAYQAELRNAATAQKNAGTQYQTELGNLFAGGNAANQSALGSTNDQAQKDAGTRGASVDPGVLARGQQAANQGSLAAQAFAALARGQSAAGNTQASGMAEQVAPLAKFAALQNAQNNTGNVQSQLTALGGAKGAYATEYKGSRLSDEQKNLIAAQALKLDTTVKLDPKTGVPYSAETAAAKAKSSAHNRASTMTKYNVSQGALDAWAKTPAGRVKRQKVIDDYNKMVHPPKDAKTGAAGKPTTAAVTKVVEHVKGANNAARRLMATPNANSAEVRALLAAGKVDGTKYTPDEINAAFDLLPTNLGGLGGLSAANVKALKKLGVTGTFPSAKPKVTIAPGTNIATS